MKKINKLLFGMLGVATLLLSSCGEEIVRDPSPEVKDGNQVVYFPSTNKTLYELDPADAKVVNLVVQRIDSVSAANVPLTIIRNDSSIFVFPETVSFAAGQKSAVLSVSFPNAVEGIPYSFEVSVAGEDYLNPYSTTVPTVKVSVTRVKWDVVGQGQFYDSFMLYSVADVTIAYSALKKMYRFANPYSQALLEEAEWGDWIGGPTTDYIQFQVTSTGNVKFDKWYVGCNYISNGENLGPIMAYFPSVLGDIRGITTYDVEDAQSIVDPENDKLLRLFPRFYVIGVGGWGLKPCYISLPGGPDLNEIL